MESKNIVLALIVICLISLLLGVFNSFNRNTAVSRSKVSTGKNVSKMIVSSNKIALIKLNGIISADENSSFISDDKNAKSALNALKLALEDSSVKGVVLQINTPGGTVAMSQNLYDAIIRLRNEKPVVVSMDDIATSGGYYVASAADRIVAQNGTITGSIGVIYSNLDMHK